MSSWFVAPALKTLFAEINSVWPNRDKSTDGTIGDAAHSSRDSEHNPNDDPKDSVPDGAVTAADIDKDGINVKKLLNKLIGDDRVWYVIHDGTIWSRTHGWIARRYTGTNPHEGHIHVSLVQSKAAVNSTKAWGLKTVAKPKPPVKTDSSKYAKLEKGVAIGKRHPQVRDLQRLLIKTGYGPIRGAITTFYGENTADAVNRFHKAHPEFRTAGLKYDGQIGNKGFEQLQKEAE